MSGAQAQNRPARVSIDHAALKHNLARVRTLCPTSNIMAVIKADGYGHGLLEVATALANADEFAVNGMDEALRLRDYGISKPLTLLSENCPLHQLQSMSELQVRPTLFDYSQLQEIKQLGDTADLSIWLKVDTGMGRLGFTPKQLPDALDVLKRVAGIRDIGLMTHLANADQADHPANHQQIELFRSLATSYDFSALSALNSGGIVNYSSNAFDLLRPGIMLYGISPSNDISAASLNLKPAMTFSSELISVKELPAGSSVGYGSTYRLDAATKLGVIACGYGDGYPRHAANGTPVFVGGRIVPLIGRVSMDLITVDLGDLDAQVGDTVELWGANNPIENVAAAAQTIGYELCCGILPRVARYSINQLKDVTI